jgi:hypothetical protein
LGIDSEFASFPDFRFYILFLKTTVDESAATPISFVDIPRLSCLMVEKLKINELSL